MKIHFLGASGTVTGSCYLLEINRMKILVDCGLFQGSKELRDLNQEAFPYNPAEIDYLLLTHAHIDHSGLIPRLCKSGFNGRIICTDATRDLASVMLPDSGHIQEMEIEWQNRKRRRAGKSLLEPLYTAEDGKDCLKFFKDVGYDEWFVLSPECKVRFRDAGHILGSAFLELVIANPGKKSTRLVFSGDLGFDEKQIIRGPELCEEADYLIIESTYGDRLHKGRSETAEQFLSILKQSLKDKGNIIIPAFAVERTQEILFMMNNFIEQKMIKRRPVFIDSPLAISATDIFRKYAHYYNEATTKLLESGDNPFEFPGLSYTRTTEESRHINEVQGAIIVSASGMCDAGRIKHHLKYNLWREECHVIFVGYQAIGTLGRKIVDGAPAVKIFGDEIAVKAHIHTIGGFSAHADQRELLKWLGQFKKKPKKIFVVHGEPKSSYTFSRKITSEFGLRAEVPERGDVVEIF